MKFRSKETGNVFEHHSNEFCGEFHVKGCEGCPIAKELGRKPKAFECARWIVENPVIAASLMGYDLVEMVELTKVVAPKRKPRICDILGVEVEERFSYEGSESVFWVSDDGVVYEENEAWVYVARNINLLINNSDKIVRAGKFTDQEIEDAKTVFRMFGETYYTHVKKTDCGDVKLVRLVWGSKTKELFSISLQSNMFESLEPGQVVSLESIARGGGF